MMTAWWTDPSGRRRLVQVVGQTKATATIEYFDNDRRTIAWRNGRRYSCATRVRLVVYQNGLRVAAAPAAGGAR